MKAKLSVVIVNYGTADIVEPCLASLALDSQIGLIEIILVDNATPGFAADELHDKFPWVKIISNLENRGFAAGCNLGMMSSRSEYILLLNPDTTVRPGTLTKMLDYMMAHPEVGALTCRVNLENGDLDPACHRGFPTPWASLTYVTRLERLFPRSRVFGRYHMTWLPFDAEHEIDSPSGCFYLTRHSVIDSVGLLDEDYFMYGEDLDWSLRIKQAGWKIMFHPGAEITHRKGSSSGIKTPSAACSPSGADRRRAYHAFHDAMRVFYDKHYRHRYPFLVRWLVMIAIAFREKLGQDRLTV
jgi:hypothetical protein